MDPMELEDPSDNEILQYELIERLADSHIHSEDDSCNPDNRFETESSKGIMDTLFAPTRYVGGWFNWLGASNDNKSTTEEDSETKIGIFSHLDNGTLASPEIFNEKWPKYIDQQKLWKKFIQQKFTSDFVWRKLAEKRGWITFLSETYPDDEHSENLFYRKLFLEIIYDINDLRNNWKNGTCKLQRIKYESKDCNGVYCMQYDDKKIIAGSREGSIKIFDRNTLKCIIEMWAYDTNVLCLQFDDKIIVSGSSDGKVRVWDVNTGELINVLIGHTDAVLSLKFQNDVLVTGSKDCCIIVWDMKSPTEIQLRRIMFGHQVAVNVVDFDDKYIISGSGDGTIKVWNIKTCETVRTLSGHKKGIACLQYNDRLVVSGSSDKTIRIWNIETGECYRTLEGHEELVRCIRFDNKYIISGDYKGEIKIWHLMKALDPREDPKSLCLCTLKQGHNTRIFRIQLDDFQIISASQDDTILIWDFLNDKQGNVVSDSNVYDFCNIDSIGNDEADAPCPTSTTTQSDDEFVMV